MTDTRLTRRQVLFGAVAALTAGAAAGCGSDGAGNPSRTRDGDGQGPYGRPEPSGAGDTSPDSPTPGGDAHPPSGFGDLAAIFDPVYAPMGLRLTRASVVDRQSYAVSATGNHLALYVEPIDDPDYGVDEYVAAIVPVTAASSPMVFERWSGLDSYDICQEPARADDPRPNPTPVTQIELTRAASDGIDWDTVTLRDLIAVTLESEGSRLVASSEIQAHPVYAEALEAARTLTGR